MAISTNRRADGAPRLPKVEPTPVESAEDFELNRAHRLEQFSDDTDQEIMQKFGFYCADDIEPQDIKWLWEPYIPAGMLSTIEGDPGVGKSWLTCMIAACVTRGWALPGSTPSAPAQVFMMSGEDSLPHVMVPRLRALGADMTRISFPTEQFKFEPATLKLLSDYLTVLKMAVVFIDPIQHWMGGERDINKANEVRDFLSGLNMLASVSGCAIVLVRHLRKAGGGTKIYRGLGSIDFVAAARSSLQVSRSPHDNVAIIEHVKCNVGPLGRAIGYQRVEDKFEWVEGVTPPVAATKRGRKVDTARAMCEQFLIEQLKDGPKLAKDIELAAVQANLPLATMMKAKMHMVSSTKLGTAWQWTLKAQTNGDIEPGI